MWYQNHIQFVDDGGGGGRRQHIILTDSVLYRLEAKFNSKGKNKGMAEIRNFIRNPYS
ncbi:MAG: hypothetical protein GY820_10265 [Gammaproteobacteria bacterium]|nr:hypothetical protein [Gammaproteobacteria bacterium]